MLTVRVFRMPSFDVSDLVSDAMSNRMQRVREILFSDVAEIIDRRVCRLLFNPFVHWWRRGPIAHQIHKFLWSDAALHYKISMMACTSLSR